MEERYGSGSGYSSNKSEKSKVGSSRECSNNKRDWKKNFSPVGDIFGLLISYLIITYAPAYFPGFFLEGWSAVYIVIIFSIIIHVAVDLILLVLQYRPFYYLGQVITGIAGIISMMVMVTIFPFNFPGNIGAIVQFALWIAIVIVAICTIFDFLKIFTPERQSK